MEEIEQYYHSKAARKERLRMNGVNLSGVDSGILDLSTRDHLIHDYNQVKSYKGYYSCVSLTVDYQ